MRKMVVEWHNISKTFEEKKVLNRVSLALEEGGIYCLMGASGIGKTTLLRILMGLETPDEPQDDEPFPAVRISAVFQENRLCGYANAVKNIRIAAGKGGLLFSPEQVLDGLLEKEAQRRPVETLSGGMQRRAAIARALAVKSELLLMDEPFAGLDGETKRRTIAKILECRADRTLVVVTHQEEDAQLLGGRMIRMTDG